MFMKRPRHRVFDYTPRYYDPDLDPKEREKRRLGFSRNLSVKRKKRSPVIWIILVIIIVYIILKLNNIG
jgi:hypothetical protein